MPKLTDRAKQLCKIIAGTAFNQRVEAEPDLYDSPSCGLFCGK